MDGEHDAQQIATMIQSLSDQEAGLLRELESLRSAKAALVKLLAIRNESGIPTPDPQDEQNLMDTILMARTQREAIRAIGSLTGGNVQLGDLARWLKQSGKWSGSEAAIKISVSRILRDDPSWVRLGHGQYRLVM